MDDLKSLETSLKSSMDTQMEQKLWRTRRQQKGRKKIGVAATANPQHSQAQLQDNRDSRSQAKTSAMSSHRER